jgi:putative transposase
MRLQHYDYAKTGAYFVTICTHNRACTFGEVTGSLMVQNMAGRMVESIWCVIPGHYSNVSIDAFVVMPNHVHGLLFITKDLVGARFIAPESIAPNLGEVVRAFKARCSHAINKIHGKGTPLWQRNYYEHVVRDEDDLMRIREYIENNPAQWALDEENPELNAMNWGAMNLAPTVPDD